MGNDDNMDYGYGDAAPENTDYGYGDDAAPDNADYGYGDAAPEADYGYGDSSPADAGDYGYGDAAPDESPPKPSKDDKRPKRRCSVTLFSIEAKACNKPLDYTWQGNEAGAPEAKSEEPVEPTEEPARDYGYGDDLAPENTDYGYGDDAAPETADYGYGDAAPEANYGYGDAAPEADYGYGDAEPDAGPPPAPSKDDKRPKRRCSVTLFSIEAKACNKDLDYGWQGDQAAVAADAKPEENEEPVGDGKDYGYGEEPTPDTADYGYGDAAPEVADYGYGDAAPETDYGYGDDAAPATDYGYGDDAAPANTDYGYGDAAPESDYGYGDAAPDAGPPPAPSKDDKRPKRRCSVTRFSIEAEACSTPLDYTWSGDQAQGAPAPAGDEKSQANTESTVNTRISSASNDGGSMLDKIPAANRKAPKKGMMSRIRKRLSIIG
jgi:hypothetical protein